MPVKCRGAGGGEFIFDFPLAVQIRDQIDRGETSIVELLGEDKRPELSSKRDDWVRYLHIVHEIPLEDMEGDSKQILTEWADQLEENWGI